MKKILLALLLGARLLSADNEILLESANAYKNILRDNDEILAADLVDKSATIIIFPRFYKVGFIFGGIGGKGVMMTKQDGSWVPKSVNIGGANVGIQIGFESSYLVLYIINENIAKDIDSGKVTLNSDISVSFANLGANAKNMIDTGFDKDIYAYSNNKGLYAGANLGGSVIATEQKVQFDLNSYGFKNLVNALENVEVLR